MSTRGQEIHKQEQRRNEVIKTKGQIPILEQLLSVSMRELEAMIHNNTVMGTSYFKQKWFVSEQD